MVERRELEDFKVEQLNVGRLGDAYPLIRSATRVTRQRWESFGRGLIGRSGGILAATGPDGCIHGVATFRPAIDLRHGTSLDVEVMVSFELCGADRVREQLVTVLAEIAATYRCDIVNFRMPAKKLVVSPSPSGAALRQLGLKLETANFIHTPAQQPQHVQTRK